MYVTEVDLLHFSTKSFSSAEKLLPVAVSDDRGGCVKLHCGFDIEETAENFSSRNDHN